MFKKIRYLIITVIISLTLIISASASDIVKYTVVKGDSMWKIATRYQVGVES